MEYQLKFHFAVTTKSKSYTEFNIVLLKISCHFCSSLHPATAEHVRFQSVPLLMKKMLHGKNILWEYKFKSCSSMSAFQIEHVTGAAFEVTSQNRVCNVVM